jgi:DNA-binding NarL/FixJ family response regulator
VDIESELAGELRVLVERYISPAHRAGLERDVEGLLANAWPAVREFVLTGKPMPEEVLSLVFAAADGIPRRTLVKITRRFAAIAARKLVSLGVERGADSAALSGRALVATHDVVSVVLTRPRAVGFAGAHRLDDLECHILGMAAPGLSTAEIAAAVHYSRQAVSYHLGRLMNRFKVPNRTALVAFAYEQGLFERQLTGGLPEQCGAADR